MGVGIAHAFLLSGAEIVLMERDLEAADKAKDRLQQAVQASVDRGTVARGGELLARVTSVTDPEQFAGVDLVIEAVPEQLELKRDVLARIESQLDASAWLASNTSSLSIDQLSEVLQRPQRFCGLHFFNPVPSSSLVEVVEGSRTMPELIEQARDWVCAIDKTAIVVRDSPGFASSRLGLAIALEAIRMVESGVASADDIDAAMVLGYRFPVGPLRLTDLVGLDVRLAIAEYLEGELGAVFTVPQLLRDKVAAGQLGRKAGAGFFKWDD
jgi:3-hydroxybutyryl-CoA dehydrogenase